MEYLDLELAHENESEIVEFFKHKLNIQTNRINKLHDAYTNDMYLIETDDSRFILRIFGCSSNLFINRDEERYIFKAMSMIYPEIDLICAFKNGRLEKYVDSVTLRLVDYQESRIQDLIIKRLKSLHQIDLDIDGEPVLFKRICNMLSRFDYDCFDIELLLETVRRLQSKYEFAGTCFTHND